LTLHIKPVKLNKSIYIRIPNDIADLIGIDTLADLTLNIVDRGDEFLLVYSGRKPRANVSLDQEKGSKVEGAVGEVSTSPRIVQ
jgi:hypothetical protein